MFELEIQIQSWSDHLRARGNFTDADISELEDHLRDEIEDLIAAGLAPDESFLISVKRLGNVDAVSHEFAKVNTENLWKHLFIDPVDSIAKKESRRDIFLVVIFALLAGTLIKIPGLFGLGFDDLGADHFYLRNMSLFILPFIAAFFLIKRKANRKTWSIIMANFIIAALIINIYPSFSPYNTEILSSLHLPLLLWLIVGAAYIGRKWQSSQGRMNFIRFTGEMLVYGVLVSAGVMVCGMFTMAIFKAIQVDAGKFLGEYYVVYGACAAVFITAYLVEAKKSVVENFAPILAKIFSPLFLVIMVSFLVVMIITGKSPFMEREFLIAFDLMLALVLGLVLYVISSRNDQQPPNLFDYLNLALILTALLIDGVALSAILFRLSAFGITPNKVAALGENLILLGNLGGLAWLYIAYFKKKLDFIKLEKWQTGYLNVYFIWTAIVAFIFPILFGFY
ncbi:MAG: hypothetical protein CVU90_14345 [Firmicutes bacterium HGW-Firmicutes-15]|nr:MAG: hypothetical protein CVU90_14345 [Firmicutes bacterium HGW-Firmicutes-15]